jgi:hypothetical protein
MGAFDDLIPAADAPASVAGAFAQQPPAAGTFDDLIPAAQPSGQFTGPEPPPGSIRPEDPGLGRRFLLNAREGFQSTLAGEAVNRVQSGQVAGKTAADINRAIAEAEQRGSPAGLEVYSDGKPSPYGSVPLDILRQTAAEQRRMQAEKAPVYAAERGAEQAEMNALPSFRQAGSIGQQLLQGATALLGQLAGGLPTPEAAIAAPARGAGIARNIVSGVAEGATGGLVADPVVQAGRVSRGEQQGFEMGQLAESVLIGGGAGGALRIGGLAWRGLRDMIAARRGVDPATITPEAVTPDEAQQTLDTPEFQQFARTQGLQPEAPRPVAAPEPVRAVEAPDTPERIVPPDTPQRMAPAESITARPADDPMAKMDAAIEQARAEVAALEARKVALEATGGPVQPTRPTQLVDAEPARPVNDPLPEGVTPAPRPEPEVRPANDTPDEIEAALTDAGAPLQQRFAESARVLEETRPGSITGAQRYGPSNDEWAPARPVEAPSPEAPVSLRGENAPQGEVSAVRSYNDVLNEQRDAARAGQGGSFKGMRTVNQEATSRAYDAEGKPEVDALAREIDAPPFEHDRVARYYNRADDESPRQAADRALNRYYDEDHAAAMREEGWTSEDRAWLDNPDNWRDPVARTGTYRAARFGNEPTPFTNEPDLSPRRRDEPEHDIPFDTEGPNGGRPTQGSSAADAAGGEGGSAGRQAPGGEPAGGSPVRAPQFEPERRDAAGNLWKQGVIPGAERISDAQQAKRGIDAPLRGGDKPPPEGGLFDTDARAQTDMFDAPKGGARKLTDVLGDESGALNLGPAVDALGKHADRYLADTAERFEHLREMRREMDTGKKVPWYKHYGVMGDLARMVLHTVDGRGRVLAKHYKSETIDKAMDMLHAPADMGRGRTVARTFNEAVTTHSQSNLNALAEILDPWIGSFAKRATNKGALKQIEQLVKNPQNIRPGTPIHDAAAKVRKLVEAEWKYLKDAGVEVGKVEDYYPRIVDPRRVLRNQARFQNAAARQYLRDGLATSPVEAAEKANAWLSSIVLGHAGAKQDGTDFVLLGGTPSADFRKERIFGNSIERDPDNPLRDFYVDGIADTLTLHFQRTARRAEWARRMGDDLGKWKEIKQQIIDEGNAQALPELVDLLGTGFGVYRAHIGSAAESGAAFARTAGALGLLPHATITSLSEAAMPAIRAGAPQRILGDIIKTLGATATKRVMKEGRGIAEDIGIIRHILGDSIIGQRYHALENSSKFTQGMVNSFFRGSLLEPFTEATRVLSVNTGRVFLRRLALDVANGGTRQNSSRALLRELGIENTDAFAGWLAGKGGTLSRADLRVEGDMEEAYKTALIRFSRQSSLAPDPSIKPRYASHPLGSLIFQLNSYTYAFQKNVLNRVAKGALEATTKGGYNLADRATLLAPAMMLPLLAAIQYGLDEPRQEVLGAPGGRKDDTPEKQALRALGRGMPTIYEPFINWHTGARYGRDAATMAAGPVIGSAFSGADAFIRPNSPNTNTGERKHAEALWNLAIEPLLQAATTALPMAARVPATFYTGSGRAREAFTEAVAGPKKQPKPKGAPRAPRPPKAPRP